MNREEAIRCLSVHSSTNGSGLCTDEQHYKAKQMAIQALSQEPCDSVSREAVKEIINDIRDCISVEGYCAILERLKKLPPITQKSGKWENLYRCWMCSECGKLSHIEHNYCPNCGARMFEPQESEDKE